MSDVHRYIEAFSKKTEKLSHEVEFDLLPELYQLQSIFKEQRGNPMYEAYPIDEGTASQLRPFLNHAFCFNKYDYFLVCTSL